MILTLSRVFLVLPMSRVAVVWLRSFPAAEASSGRSQPSVSATTDVSPAWSTSRRSPGHRRLCPSRLRRRNCTVEVSISVRSTPWPVLRLPLLLLTHPVSVIRTSYDYRLTLRTNATGPNAIVNKSTCCRIYLAGFVASKTNYDQSIDILCYDTGRHHCNSGLSRLNKNKCTLYAIGTIMPA